MPSVARETDNANTGHDCVVTTTIAPLLQTGNIKFVFANNLGISCLGDPLTAHLRGPTCETPCPEAQTTSASSTVFIGGKGVVRIGDECDAAGIILGGSGNVFVGG